jgi:glycosyltransferase involved in cell wall biosynthesis
MTHARRSPPAVLLYRPSLDYRSGAGQLLWMQLRGLRDAGVHAQLACERGALRFLLRTGVRVRRMSAAQAAQAAAADATVVDHGMCVPEAAVVFVHNLMTAANRYLQRPELAAQAAAEEEFFGRLAPLASPVVANSELVRTALVDRFGLSPERVRVAYPGVRADVFTVERAPALRAHARRQLDVPAGAPLVGLVTSGDFHKRGLDLFLAAAEEIHRAAPETRFLVVGSKRLPAGALAHPLVRAGVLRHRPKSSRPDLWLAALDLLLYTARYEEFGLVVAEALALGVPVLTSKRVGASECLPAAYADWLVAEPKALVLATKALALLSDADRRRELAEAGAAAAARLDEKRYVAETVALIRAAAR